LSAVGRDDYELATGDYYEFAGFAGQVNVRIVGI
jgi:hypothetical protein